MNPTTQSLVHPCSRSLDVTVEHHTYATDLGLELYRPPQPAAASPAVILVTGYADPGATAMFGKPFKDWASYQGWARLLAARGLIAITYVNRQPADAATVVQHVRAHAATLGIDAERLGVWACSGHVPTALDVIAREQIAAAALLYGFVPDLPGATRAAEAAAAFHFALPPVSLAELPQGVPLLFVRATRDTTPGLDDTLVRFLAAASERALAVTVLEHPGPHAFDLVEDTPEAHATIDQVVAFLVQALAGCLTTRNE